MQREREREGRRKNPLLLPRAGSNLSSFSGPDRNMRSILHKPTSVNMTPSEILEIALLKILPDYKTGQLKHKLPSLQFAASYFQHGKLKRLRDATGSERASEKEREKRTASHDSNEGRTCLLALRRREARMEKEREKRPPPFGVDICQKSEF